MVKKLHEDAVVPTYAKIGDSGFDLYAVEDVIIEPGETKIVRTGLAFQIRKGYEIQVRPRSGISTKTKLRVTFGTVDNGYRGEVGVIVDNTTNRNMAVLTPQVKKIDGTSHSMYPEVYPKGTMIVRKGDRLGQGVLCEVPMAEFIVVDELESTERGTNGYGHSGV